eukprot:TRINITY_DN1836_c0_g1_i11.p1 TRINITY_DN1836_c0_g1~~TRINITY_DN1836_c0_g1_i11.p1  ORF type:complete len:131 (-),score=39.47 TRINITY_DN1836_c0_g1_i11:192-584(-)
MAKGAKLSKEDDFSRKFGNQLISKMAGNEEGGGEGGGEALQQTSFFFFNAQEDDRIKEAMKFFFEDRPDLDSVREGYQKKRADLKDIFRKRARSKAQLLRKNVKSSQNQNSAAPPHKKRRRRQNNNSNRK